jgi:hypothetical protein
MLDATSVRILIARRNMKRFKAMVVLSAAPHKQEGPSLARHCGEAQDDGVFFAA